MTTSRATLNQVAERAGVSLGSTSRALHGTGASAAMVEKVERAAKELGYSPDAVGRSLRMKRTFQIAFAVADIGNPVYVEMMSAIHEVMAPSGYRVVVTSTGDTAESAVDLVRSLSHGMVDGVILSPLRVSDALVSEIQRSAVPVVVIGRSLASEGIDSVSTDSAGGIGQAVAHLTSLGRRRMAFINGPLDTTPGSARQRGFDDAISQDGFDADIVESVVADDFTVAGGMAAAHALFERHAHDGGIDAIVAANDLLAIGVMHAARESGLTVPDDVAVTGMDDTEIGKIFYPRLTSVSLGSSERGRRAATMMLGLVVDGDDSVETGTQHVSVGPELVIRDSTATAQSNQAVNA